MLARAQLRPRSRLAIAPAITLGRSIPVPVMVVYVVVGGLNTLRSGRRAAATSPATRHATPRKLAPRAAPYTTSRGAIPAQGAPTILGNGSPRGPACVVA